MLKGVGGELASCTAESEPKSIGGDESRDAANGEKSTIDTSSPREDEDHDFGFCQELWNGSALTLMIDHRVAVLSFRLKGGQYS
jgi:hypothetical protein